jgi:hypothetical protein
VLDAIRDWAAEFGEQPRCSEWSPSHARRAGARIGLVREWERQYPRWPSLSTVSHYFGSWSNGVEAAGFRSRQQRPTESALGDRVALARRLTKVGRTNREIADLLGVSPRTVRDYLRAGVCRGCGGPVITSRFCKNCCPRRVPDWSPEAVVAAITAWTVEEGRLPRVDDWKPRSQPRSKWAREYPRWPSYMTVRTIFGSWNAGLEAAGYAPTRRYWGQGSIIAALKAAGKETRPAALRVDGNGAQLPAAQTVRKHFGSMSKARSVAGIQAGRRRWNRASILRAMGRFQQRRGRLPTERDWQRATSEHPHATTVRQQFGSWSAALAELDADNDS